jgi:hypothetical protein
MDARRPRSKLRRQPIQQPTVRTVLQKESWQSRTAVQQEDTPLISKPANLLLQPAYLKAATAQRALKGAVVKPHLQQPNPRRTVLQTSMSGPAPVMAAPSSPSPLSAEARETDLQITGMTPPPSSSSPADLQRQITDLRRKVNANTGDIASNKRAIQKHRLETELGTMIGKFRVLGYKWKVTDFKSRTPTNPATPTTSDDPRPPPTTARRKFIKMMIQVVFVNQGLIAESQNTDSLISDCYPAMGA